MGTSIWVLIAKRLGLGLLTLWVVSVVIFFSVELLPGDLAQEILGQSATADTVAAWRRETGLDRPALERYVEWLGGAVQLDFGLSLANRQNINELIADRLYNTLFLALYAAVVAVPIAIFLGILAALYRNGWFDRGVNTVTLTSISFPEFFVAYILSFVLATTYKMFPAVSVITPETTFLEHLEKAFLPALTLILVVVAHMMRMTRAAIINVLSSPYIEMARLKGMSRWRVIVHHALPNAWAPIVNVVALNLAYLIVGVVLVEVVFAYKGLGQYMVDNVRVRDANVVQACAIIFAATYIGLNMLADIFSILSNPRLRHPRT